MRDESGSKVSLFFSKNIFIDDPHDVVTLST
jgi:hypothetical protein